MSGIRDLVREMHRRSLWQVLGIYLGGSWAVYVVIQSLTEGLGLPSWMPALAIVLLLVGLPIVIATAVIQDGPPRPGASSSNTDSRDTDVGTIAEGRTVTPQARSGATRLFTWRNAVTGGVLAFAAWGVAAAGILAFGPSFDSGGELPDNAVAVLPFENLSADPENDYFASGVHEEILTQLSKLDALRVISRTSVQRYADSDLTLQQIAAELGASRIMEGSVQRVGDRVRITTQLIDARTDEHLWAERYDRRLDDIFYIQTDVARSIAAAIGGTLSPEDRADLEEVPTSDLEAYGHYLRGLEAIREIWVYEQVVEAGHQFRRAISLDPAFAAAQARLVQVQTWLDWNYGEIAQRDSARATLERLEREQPGSYHARFARGLFDYYGDQRYEAALETFRELGEERPGDQAVRNYIAALNRRLGRMGEAVRIWEEYLDRDPADWSTYRTLAQTYVMVREYDQALRSARISRSLEPESGWGMMVLVELVRGDTAAARVNVDSARLVFGDTAFRRIAGLVELLSGRQPDPALEGGLQSLYPFESAIEAAADTAAIRVAARQVLEALEPLLPDSLRLSRYRLAAVHARIGKAYAHLGDTVPALHHASRAVQLFPVSHDAFYGPRFLYNLAQVELLVGSQNRTLELLERLLEIPSEYVHRGSLALDPFWARLRTSPRFRRLLEPAG